MCITPPTNFPASTATGSYEEILRAVSTILTWRSPASSDSCANVVHLEGKMTTGEGATTANHFHSVRRSRVFCHRPLAVPLLLVGRFAAEGYYLWHAKPNH